MPYRVYCTQCQMEALGLHDADGELLRRGMELNPKEFRCPVCGRYPMVIGTVSEKDYYAIKKEVKAKKSAIVFCSKTSVFPCPKCGSPTQRRLFGHWRSCPVCGKWTKTIDIKFPEQTDDEWTQEDRERALMETEFGFQ